jgi:hypothetical protein
MKQPVQYRSASAAAQQAKAALPAVSFESDIVPIFQPYQGNMMWRFDILSYDAVKANADLIFSYISAQAMPPPPFDPLSDGQIATFKAWMAAGFPP